MAEPEPVTMWVGVPEGGLTAAEKEDPFACKLGGFFVAPKTALGEAAARTMKKEAKCDLCGDPLYLVAQAYCPLADTDRIFFAFACNSSFCHTTSARMPWKVWLYQDKAAPAAETADDEGEDIDADTPVCNAEPWTFPEMAVDTFEEPEVEGNEEALRRLAEGGGGTLASELSEEDVRSIEETGLVGHKDACVAKFQTRLHLCPQQVLRWGFGGKPLWIAATHRPASIPACSVCGAAQVFELQLVPTLIWKLRTDEHLKPNKRLGDDGLDFGTVVVYSCSKCTEHESGLTPAFFHVQPPLTKE
ncbi:putative programmed cell death protein 2 [Diplonema papillatum]|nr:putative programmed cell death protein 2 [Diplonema papillatum]